MTPAQLLVVLGGLILSGAIAWFFWGPRRGGYRAALASSGFQEVLVLVKGGYTPDLIVVSRNKPVRLNFRREETVACSEMVVLDAFKKSAKLPQGQTVALEFMPDQPGEYTFACQMGMYKGKLIVE